MWTRQDLQGAEFAPKSHTTQVSLHGPAAFLAVVGACLLSPTTAHAEAGAPRFETIVTAPRTPPAAPREDDAASASVITSDRTVRSGESLPQLLSELPGVSITRLGASGSTAMVSVRGSTPNQVQIYVDGVPLQMASGGAVDLGLIPIADSDRIEVYRGASPIGFGSSAIGGIVSLTTSMPDVSGGAAELGVGSFGTRFGGGHAGFAGSLVKVVASVHLLETAGDFPYVNDNGTAFRNNDDVTLRRQNNALSQTDGVLRAAFALPGRRSLLASASYLLREQGLPAAGAVTSWQASFGMRRLIASAAYQGQDDLGPGGRVHAQAYAVLGQQRFRDELHEISLAPTATRDRTDTFGTTARATYAFGAWLKTSAMLDARHESFRPFDELAATPSGAPATRDFAAAGIESDLWSQRRDASLISALRVEFAHDEIGGRDAFGNQALVTRPSNYVVPVARLGAIGHVTDVAVLRANAGRYARLPTMLERYGNTGRIVGNPTLQPESGVTADLGSRLTLGGPKANLTIDAALFGARVDRLIQFQRGAYQMRAANIGRARIWGAELSLQLNAGRHARLVTQGTFTDARDTSGTSGRDGRQLPLRPRLRLYGRPEWRALPLGTRWELGFFGDVDVTGGNYLDPANLAAVPARVLFGGGAYVLANTTGLRGVLSAQNLGDSRINDVADFPLPGRSIFLSLQWSSIPTPQ